MIAAAGRVPSLGRLPTWLEPEPARPLSVSFEFFPPRTLEAEATLWDAVARLAPLRPEFVSVTYGAGGSTRERTHRVITHLRRESELTPAAHITCVGATRAEIEEIVASYWEAGVRHMVALRGDPPEGVGGGYRPHPDGFGSTAELVAAIREIGDFEVSVAAYPERHPESASFDADLDLLAAKVEAGATRAITQFFVDNDRFYRYRERLERRGIEVSLVPGILPIANIHQTTRFAQRCGAEIPGWLTARYEGLDDDPDTRRLVAAAGVASQVFDLQANGVDAFHFYTLNRAELVYASCHLLGLRPVEERAAA